MVSKRPPANETLATKLQSLSKSISSPTFRDWPRQQAKRARENQPFHLKSLDDSSTRSDLPPREKSSAEVRDTPGLQPLRAMLDETSRYQSLTLPAQKSYIDPIFLEGRGKNTQHRSRKTEIKQDGHPRLDTSWGLPA